MKIDESFLSDMLHNDVLKHPQKDAIQKVWAIVYKYGLVILSKRQQINLSDLHVVQEQHDHFNFFVNNNTCCHCDFEKWHCLLFVGHNSSKFCTL